MKTTISVLTILTILSFPTSLVAQDQKEKGVFVEEKDGYYKNEILKSIDEFNESGKGEEKIIHA